jgi:hypothetical protein
MSVFGINGRTKIMPLHKKNILIFKAFLIVVLSMCLHMGDVVDCKELHKEVPPGPGTVTQEHMMVSQLEEGKPAEKKTPSSSERRDSDSETETNPEDNDVSSGSEREPLKRFVPSEKIAPDQAVDFPWDI